jgi:hypothetical protein
VRDSATDVVPADPAGPHTGTTFDIIGSLGVAITVPVGATVAMDRRGGSPPEPHR